MAEDSAANALVLPEEDNIGVDSPESVLAKLTRQDPENEIDGPLDQSPWQRVLEELIDFRKEVSALDDNVGGIDDKVAAIQANAEASQNVLDDIQDQVCNSSEDLETLKQAMLTQAEDMKNVKKQLAGLLKMVTFLYQEATTVGGDPALAIFGAKRAMRKSLPTGEAKAAQMVEHNSGAHAIPAANGAPEREPSAGAAVNIQRQESAAETGVAVSFKRTRDFIR